MTASRTFLHRIGWSASGLMMVAAAVGMSVPSASADTSPDGWLALDVSPPPGGYVVGVKANITVEGIGGAMFPVPQSRVTLSDNGTCVYSFYPGQAPPGFSYMSWVPTTAGTHTISITQYGATVSETVTVNPAPDGTPVPTPETPGCSGGGSIDTGSLGF
ncbi:hypothetical protein BTZ20_0149 [Rhodococcus sp. MTM3W5.2]|uniref:hypothetical protein n=1 Tax=Rhodococcus sp. MTM3W5.2 TaxID=1805827 RepID=UPI0009790C26|nr:hypothetical protein [Rhodococcus sp. MTM3W5.2]AQA25153.1 hypothetical protein BTZ20_0149 [Rhodococcus sp. MTM3W5.2]